MDINSILNYLKLLQILIALWQASQVVAPARSQARLGQVAPDPEAVSTLTDISKSIAPTLPDEQHVKLATYMAAIVTP